MKITWVQQRQHHRARRSARERVLSLALRELEILFPEQKIVRSSAKRSPFTGGLTGARISLIPIRKRVPLITDPCGTPFSVLMICDKVLLILTWIVQSLRKFPI